MEQVIEWLNENEQRAYPFLEDAPRPIVTTENAYWSLPDDFLLDAQIVVTTDVSIASAELGLTKISVDSEGTMTCYVGFEDAIDLQTFEIQNALNTQQYPLYIRNQEGSLCVFGPGVATCPLLTTPTGDYLGFFPFEPTVCYQFNDAWLGVNSLATSPEKESAAGEYTPLRPLKDSDIQTKLDGHVSFLEGYNFNVIIRNNLIDLGIGADYGLRMDCETNFLSPEYLDCDDIVCFINGVPPDEEHNFRLLAGTNINVINGNTLPTFQDKFSEASNDHTIFVGLTFLTTDICSPIDLIPKE